jgi:hypothetical protein
MSQLQSQQAEYKCSKRRVSLLGKEGLNPNKNKCHVFCKDSSEDTIGYHATRESMRKEKEEKEGSFLVTVDFTCQKPCLNEGEVY